MSEILYGLIELQTKLNINRYDKNYVDLALNGNYSDEYLEKFCKMGLSKDEAFLITKYKGSESEKINKFAKKLIKDQNIFEKKLLKYFDKAISKITKFNNSKVYRHEGSFSDFFPKELSKIGKIIHKKEYYSTSTEVWKSHKIIIAIETMGLDLTKAHAIYLGFDKDIEAEVLFERNTKFLITNYYLNDDTHYVFAREV